MDDINKINDDYYNIWKYYSTVHYDLFIITINNLDIIY